jgi:hypothetical protein
MSIEMLLVWDAGLKNGTRDFEFSSGMEDASP